MKNAIRGRFTDWPDAALSIALLALAAVVVLIALAPGHHLLKAAALVWVILP